MHLKDTRNRINKKIDANYKTRQKILSRIKDVLAIDFNKISIYREERNGLNCRLDVTCYSSSFVLSR